MTTVALIEDDPEYRAGIERLLADSGRFAVAGSFPNAEDALRALPKVSAQVALVDINLPGQSGPAAVLRLRELCPLMPCVMLTMSDDSENLFGALQAGAAGYLLKSAAPAEIITGLDELLAGGAPMSLPIARRVLAAFARPVSPSSTQAKLTAREQEIMANLARGLADKEIAVGLGISLATVKNHLYHVYEKLSVRCRTEAVMKWLGHSPGH